MALKAVRCEVFASFVFTNFDADCMPFEQFIAPIRALLEDLNIAEMRHYWWKSIPIPANWKVAQEAFLETCHVPATHPQLETVAADFIFGETMEEEYANFSHHKVDYQTFEHGHGRFFAGANTPMQGKVNVQGQANPVDAAARQRDDLPGASASHRSRSLHL